jgi:hypothetical protein
MANEMYPCAHTNRIFYINTNGKLFVQFRPDKYSELLILRRRVHELGERVFYVEELASGNTIQGYIVRVTKSGVTLKDWSIK